MYQLAAKLVDFLAAQQIFPDEDRDIYLYGAELLISMGSFCLVALFFGLITGNLLQVTLYLIVSLSVRSFAGGYHAPSGEKCLVLTSAIMLLVWGLYPMVPLSLAWIMVATATWIVFRYAPVIHPSSPHSLAHQKVLKRRAHIVALLVVLMIMVLSSSALSGYVGLAALSYFTAACSTGWAALQEHTDS